jgi:hypothetical protein
VKRKEVKEVMRNIPGYMIVWVGALLLAIISGLCVVVALLADLSEFFLYTSCVVFIISSKVTALYAFQYPWKQKHTSQKEYVRWLALLFGGLGVCLVVAGVFFVFDMMILSLAASLFSVMQSVVAIRLLGKSLFQM